MAEQTSTPTPAKGGRRRRRPDTRSSEQRVAVDAEADGGPEGEAGLLDLLGVGSPLPASGKAKSVLRVSKAEIEGSKEDGSGQRRSGRLERARGEASDPRGQEAHALASPTPRTRNGRRAGTGAGTGALAELSAESGGDAAGKGTRRSGRKRAGSAGTKDASIADAQVIAATTTPAKNRPKKTTSNLTASRPKDQQPQQHTDQPTHPQIRSHLPHPVRLGDLDGAPSSAFDTSALSRSLPGQLSLLRLTRAAARGGGGARETADSAEEDVWDMPVTGALKREAQNWQQQLLAGGRNGDVGLDAKETSTPRAARQRQSRGVQAHQLPLLSNAPIAANPALSQLGPGKGTSTSTSSSRPGHSRRHSADSTASTVTAQGGLPASRVQPTAGGAPSSASASGFNVPLPHLAGYNAARAPQTPVRTPGGSIVPSSLTGPKGQIRASAPPNAGTPAHAGSLDASTPQGGGVLDGLPVRGEFPRLNQGSKGPLGVFKDQGIKYAGAGFQNSPSQFARPDLDDF